MKKITRTDITILLRSRKQEDYNEYRHQLDHAAILNQLQDLYNSEYYRQVLAVPGQYWMEILYDPCSRTSSALVKPAGKVIFMEHSDQ